MIFNKKSKLKKLFNDSFVIVDKQGELLSTCASRLASSGYKIAVLNFADTEHSNAYNPFCYINDYEDITYMVEVLLNETQLDMILTSKKSEIALMRSLVSYLFYEAPTEEQNLSMIMELLRAGEPSEDSDSLSDLDRLYKLLEDKDKNHIAIKLYESYKSALTIDVLLPHETELSNDPLKILRTIKKMHPDIYSPQKAIFKSLLRRFEIINKRDIGAITIDDNIDLKTFTTMSTALFIVLPDECNEISFLVKLLLAQLMHILGKENVYWEKGVSFVTNYEQENDFSSYIKTLYSNFVNSEKRLIKMLDSNLFQKLLFNKGNIPYDVDNLHLTPFDIREAFFREFENNGSPTEMDNEKEYSDFFESADNNSLDNSIYDRIKEAAETILLSDIFVLYEVFKYPTHHKKVLESDIYIDLYDKTGENVIFELLDTIEYNDDNYIVVIPWISRLENDVKDNECDIYILKFSSQLVEKNDVVDIVSDETLLSTLYDIFIGRMNRKDIVDFEKENSEKDDKHMTLNNSEQIYAKLVAIIAEQLDIDNDRIKPSSGVVDDLGADSLDCVEVIMACEEEFTIEIPDDEAEVCVTVQDVYNLVRHHIAENSKMSISPNTDTLNITESVSKEKIEVKIPVVELFDEEGNKVVFELLDTIEYEGDKYPLLTPYYETKEEYNLDKPADVFVMKEVVSRTGDKPMLETVEDKELLQTVYALFKKKRNDEFEFRDS